MPNHVYTNLEVTGSAADISAFVAKFCEMKDGKENCIVFNRVIPMPEALSVECGSSSIIGYDIVAGTYDYLFTYSWMKDLLSQDNLTGHQIEHLKSSREDFIAWFSKHDPKVVEIGKAVASNVEIYGYKTWNEWRWAKWGTRSDAYHHDSIEIGEGRFFNYFETAWSAAIPILEAMSEAFPQLCFRMAYAEDGNSFAGIAHAEEGEVTDIDEDCRTVLVNEFGFDASDFEDDEEDESVIEHVQVTEAHITQL